MKKEFRGLMTDSLDESTILLCGIPYDKNASLGKGASLAPDTIRELTYHIPPLDMKSKILKSTKIFDLGNYELTDFEETSYKLYVDLFSRKNKFKIILGGDHSISIASEKAFYKKCIEDKKEPVIIHFDAHPDICEEYLGNKYSHACTNKRALDLGYKDENITLVGIRGFEEEEVYTLMKHPKIDVFKSVDVKTLTPEALLLLLVSKYRNDKYRIYISYDIDINDPSFAPGTGTPEAFGLNSSDVLTLILGLIKSLNVECLDIVEVSPKLDVNNITSWLAIKTLYEVFSTLETKLENN